MQNRAKLLKLTAPNLVARLLVEQAVELVTVSNFSDNSLHQRLHGFLTENVCTTRVQTMVRMHGPMTLGLTWNTL